MTEEVIFELTPKQEECYYAVKRAAHTGEIRTIGYGGAAGGGKSYGIAGIFLKLALDFPGSRWAIIDHDYELFRKNLYPTIESVFPEEALKYMSISANNPRADFHNGSQILFMNEDLKNSHKKNKWLGLEVNGAWIEQAERISKNTYSMIQSRLGRWQVSRAKGKVQPHPVMVCSMNPTDEWPKDEFYDPWEKGRLPKKTIYIPALVSDNPYYRDDEGYLAGFEFLDPLTKARLLNGDWNAFEKENRFAYCFHEHDNDKQKGHVKPCTAIKGYPLLISFDFNVEPLTFLVQQFGQGWFRTLREVVVPKISGEQIRAACDIIRHDYQDGGEYPFIVITGDPSGHNSILNSSKTAYDFIQEYLSLSRNQIVAPKAHMGLSDSRTLINTAFSCDVVEVDPSCTLLIRELKQAEAFRNQKGNIEIRKDRDKHKCDAFDAKRYGLHYAYNGWKPPGS